jgi:hypothetical protein
MAFNFPNSPTENQEFSPQPWVTYIYKAPHWIIKTSAAIVGGDDFVNVSGDVMTGPLTLSGSPTVDLHAASKKYVDDNSGGSGDATVAYVNAQDALRVLKTGDAMSGHLTLPTGPGATQAVRKDYVDAANTAQDTIISGKLVKAGDIMTGLLTLSAAPTLDLHAATKKYVDDNIGGGGGGGVTDAEMKAYAAPFDAFAYSGMQINGGAEVSQERQSTAVTLASGVPLFPVDGWRAASDGTQVISTNRAAGGPPGFLNAVSLTTVTGNATPSIGQYVFISHSIEGPRVARLNWGTLTATPITISFWMRATIIGTYSGTIMNSGNNRCYAFTFSISTSNTWEYQTVIIPGDLSGTWNKAPGQVGMIIYFAAMAGTTYQGTPGAWFAGTAYGATGTTNVVSAFGNTMLVTGLAVFPGIQAPTAAQSLLILRPYDQELLLCKRYWQQSSSQRAYIASDSSHAISVLTTSVPNSCAYYNHTYSVEMQTIPVILPYPHTTPTNIYRASSYSGVDYPANSAKVGGDSAKSFFLVNLSGGALAVVNGYMIVNWTADARI